MPRTREQTIEVSVSIPEPFARELREQYPGALRLSDAVRMAAEEGCRRRQERLTKDDIRDAIEEAAE